MISGLFDLISGIADFFGKVFEFLVFIVQEIVQIFKLAVGALGYVGSFVTSLPGAFAVLIVAACTILLIYKLKE